MTVEQIILLESERLILRQWQESDLEPFAALTSDPLVMQYFPAVLTRAESDALVKKLQNHITQHGWGFWAVELKATSECIGLVGMIHQNGDIPNAPFVEIGWRLSANHWRKGYTLEAARASLDFAFQTLGLNAVYAFTTLDNLPSIGVMEKLGMVNQQQDFNHPSLPVDHPMSRHCLYKIERDS
ncbi:GNAT family N-acetyltransferase [Marinomonas sp. 2405UD68-3]|uniref:GNAT family N-acetyltransferase n=1 Tax=Marinomonas sp. 2405UD68-3 TaxID=3391835 RepID=UPI0039C943D7